jgi:hypothetical protein
MIKTNILTAAKEMAWKLYFHHLCHSTVGSRSAGTGMRLNLDEMA